VPKTDLSLLGRLDPVDAAAARAGDVVAQRIWSSAVDDLMATTLATVSTSQTTQLLI
jgi:hypothetical protein